MPVQTPSLKAGLKRISAGISPWGVLNVTITCSGSVISGLIVFSSLIILEKGLPIKSFLVLPVIISAFLFKNWILPQVSSIKRASRALSTRACMARSVRSVFGCDTYPLFTDKLKGYPAHEE